VVQALRYLGKEGVGARDSDAPGFPISNGETKTHEGYAVRHGLDLPRGEEDHGEDRRNKIARMTPQERTDIFTETADHNRLPEAIVETEPFVSSIPVDAIHRVRLSMRRPACFVIQKNY
jgi:hypothetical protein